MTTDQKRIKQLEKALADLLESCLTSEHLSNGLVVTVRQMPDWKAIDNARAVLPNWEPKADKE